MRKSGNNDFMFIGRADRRLAKPECISAHTLRARARADRSVGQRFSAGYCSARYSAMASVSHTARPSSTSTGTLPTGETCPMACLKREPGSKLSKRSGFSSNAMPASCMSTQGRMDHEE